MAEQPSLILDEAYTQNKTRYFSQFAASHVSAFRPHYQQGETLGSGPEVWRNVSEHCLTAGVFADILAEALHITSDKRSTIVGAAIMHDWDKKHEALTQRAAQQNGTLTLQTLNDIREHDTQALRDMGVSEDVVHLTGVNVPETSDGPVSLDEKIIWYVDAMLSNTNPVPIRQRFDDLERGWDGTKEDPSRAERNRAFSELYREKYNGQSLYDVQRQIGERVGREFAQQLGYTGDPENLPLYLRDKLKERVATFNLNDSNRRISS